ncbi:unnamed protein product [Lampetra planeri]
MLRVAGVFHFLQGRDVERVRAVACEVYVSLRGSCLLMAAFNSSRSQCPSKSRRDRNGRKATSSGAPRYGKTPRQENPSLGIAI